MLVFMKAEGIYKEAAERYIRKGEIGRVSYPIEFEGKKYREIVYNRVFLGTIRKGILGVVFITEDGKAVTDGRIIKELAALAYNMEVFFDETYAGSIPRAITPEKEIQKEERDFAQMKRGLEILKNENVKGTDVVESILSKLPGLKRENNRVLKELVDRVKSFENDSVVFNKSIMDEIAIYYRRALLKNFQRVKLIAKGINYYDEIKREAARRKKKFKYRFMGRDVVEGLTKLEYGINYLKRVINVYSKVIDMSEEEYIRFLREMDRENINHKISMVRA